MGVTLCFVEMMTGGLDKNRGTPISQKRDVGAPGNRTRAKITDPQVIWPDIVSPEPLLVSES